MEDRFIIRFWLVKEERMIEPDQYEFDWENEYITINDDFCIDGQNKFEWDTEIIPMQCTGKEDKNGKFIYEGDILLITELSNGYKRPPIKRVVIYDNGEYYVKDSGLMCNHGIKDEIIGNIYENPELLELSNG
jgi:uncharacterized phage protein (TIGR01671 family)